MVQTSASSILHCLHRVWTCGSRNSLGISLWRGCWHEESSGMNDVRLTKLTTHTIFYLLYAVFWNL